MRSHQQQAQCDADRAGHDAGNGHPAVVGLALAHAPVADDPEDERRQSQGQPADDGEASEDRENAEDEGGYTEAVLGRRAATGSSWIAGRTGVARVARCTRVAGDSRETRCAWVPRGSRVAPRGRWAHMTGRAGEAEPGRVAGRILAPLLLLPRLRLGGVRIEAACVRVRRSGPGILLRRGRRGLLGNRARRALRRRRRGGREIRIIRPDIGHVIVIGTRTRPPDTAGRVTCSPNR